MILCITPIYTQVVSYIQPKQSIDATIITDEDDKNKQNNLQEIYQEYSYLKMSDINKIIVKRFQPTLDEIKTKP
jgi:hypothetical protein